MIFTEPKSELQVRLHIAEMLKDKIENDNYAELCEKAYKFITNGVVLPQTAKDPLEETMLNLSKAIQNGGNITDALPSMPKVDNKEEKLKELAYKNLKRLVTYKDIPCYICGYSVEFDYLIAGYNGSYGIECFPSPDDKFIDGATYNHYLYVPKDIVKE